MASLCETENCAHSGVSRWGDHRDCAGHTAALGLDVIWLSGHEYHAYQNWQLPLHFLRVLFIMQLYGVKLQY